MRRWLCIESDGEEFTVEANTLEEAKIYAAIYGATVKGEV